MPPALSTAKAIEKLNLKCSKSNVQKVYSRWGLSKIGKAVAVRGVQACGPNTEAASEIRRRIEPSAKARFPNLIESARLKVNGSFSMLVKRLACRSYSISNPGTIIAAPFLNQLGVVEALHNYGPETFKPVETTSDIVVNTLRIIVGFPTIHDYTLNSDRSVAIEAGLFRSVLCMPHWRTPKEWDCVLSTILTCTFSNQNCELSLHESGDLLVTYLDGDSHGIKRRLKDTLDKRRKNGLNLVPWWGNRCVRVSIKDQYDI